MYSLFILTSLNTCYDLPGFLNGTLLNGSEESEPDITKSSLLLTFDIPVNSKQNNL
jgi:hypothetical protein